jgi:hypothetical protein
LLASTAAGTGEFEVEGLMKVQLATRLDAGLRQRLRIYAAVTERTVEEVVSAALNGYLPPTSDMIRDTSRGSRGDLLAAEATEAVA